MIAGGHGFQSQPHHLLPVPPWAGLNFYPCEMESQQVLEAVNGHRVQSCPLHIVGTQQGPSTLLPSQANVTGGKYKASSLVRGDPEVSSGLGILSATVAMA